MWGELMTLLPNFTGEIVTSVMKHHMGGGGQKMGKYALHNK